MRRAKIIEAGVIQNALYYAQLEHGHETMSFLIFFRGLLSLGFTLILFGIYTSECPGWVGGCRSLAVSE